MCYGMEGIDQLASLNSLSFSSFADFCEQATNWTKLVSHTSIAEVNSLHKINVHLLFSTSFASCSTRSSPTPMRSLDHPKQTLLKATKMNEPSFSTIHTDVNVNRQLQKRGLHSWTTRISRTEMTRRARRWGKCKPQRWWRQRDKPTTKSVAIAEWKQRSLHSRWYDKVEAHQGNFDPCHRIFG